MIIMSTPTLPSQSQNPKRKSRMLPSSNNDKNNDKGSKIGSSMLIAPELLFLVLKSGKRNGNNDQGKADASYTNANNGGATTNSQAVPNDRGKNEKPSDSSSVAMKKADSKATATVAGTGTSTANKRSFAAFPETNNNSNAKKCSPLKSRANHDILAPYALHHDQIVTALIDDALRNRRDEGGININNESSNANNGVAYKTPISSIPVVDVKPDTNQKSRTSPHRIKRNGIAGVGSSPGIHILWKRQRSNSDEKLNTTTTSTAAPNTAIPLPNTIMMMRSPPSSSNLLSDPAEFLHPDCILQKSKGSEKLLKPKLSFTLSSSSLGNNNNNHNHIGDAPSAVGREETLLKLQQKLSMLSDIEAGKYGMAVEMLRSDAVAFIVQHPEDDQGNGGGGGGHFKRTSSLLSSSSQNPPPSRVAKVETRSILTLRMGFVSMSYGILLQWDYETKLVELIVLRKMCRDDFLNGTSDVASSSTARESSLLFSGLKSNSEAHHHPSPPELISAPALDSSSSSNIAAAAAGKVGIHKSSTSADHHERGPLPRLIPPPNPLAFLPRFLGNSGGNSGSNSGTTTSTTKPQYLLSVSALSVTQLRSPCENCRDSNSLVGKNTVASTQGKRNLTTATIRPYIRFALGEYEHCTRVTKFNNGNARWTKRHHNSCLLPCRPEEVRWFAGRDDLIVEVRNEWKLSNSKCSHGGGDDHSSGGGGGNDPQFTPLWPTRLFGTQNDEKDSSLANHPILAAVTVPLSSVNIEDEDSIGFGRGSWRRRGGKSKEGPPSTKITIPLRMNCCPSAPIGSISLRITIKVSTPGGGGNGCSAGGGVTSSSNYPYALSRPNIQVDFSVSGDGGNGEPKVSESIELGPLTRLMDGWSIGGGGSGVRDEVETTEKNRKDNKGSKSTAVVRQESRTTFAWPGMISPMEANEEGEKKRTSINWSKRLDHQTKKWSALKLNRTELSTTSNDADVGWFTFLRGGTRDKVETRTSL